MGKRHNQFRNTVKLTLSDKIKTCDEITLINGEKIVTQDEENAEILNSFFLSAVKNLRILEFQEVDPLADKISHQP